MLELQQDQQDFRGQQPSLHKLRSDQCTINQSINKVLLFTFTFIHLEDTFIQSSLQMIHQAITDASNTSFKHCPEQYKMRIQEIVNGKH